MARATLQQKTEAKDLGIMLPNKCTQEEAKRLIGEAKAKKETVEPKPEVEPQDDQNQPEVDETPGAPVGDVNETPENDGEDSVVETPEDDKVDVDPEGDVPPVEPQDDDVQQPEDTDDNITPPEPVEPQKVDTEESIMALNATSDLDIQSVKDLLVVPGLAIGEKLKIISQSGPLSVKLLTTKLIGYNAELNPAGPTKDTKTMAAKGYDLYVAIKAALEVKDPELFKLNFDIINLAFFAFAKESFGEFMLRRGVEEWTWGEKSFNTYSNLCTVICILASVETRKENIKKVEFGKAFEGSALKAQAVENIKSYYAN